MSAKLEWTTKLGDAVLAQQPNVMDAIQRLRTKADADNKLTSTKEQRVAKTQSRAAGRSSHEQTNPDTLYVPYYDPAVVYGGGHIQPIRPTTLGIPDTSAPGSSTELAFGAGWALGRWGAAATSGAGHQLERQHNNININRPRVNPLDGNNCQRRRTRQGVKYNNSNVRQKFGNNNRGSVQNRMDFPVATAITVLIPALRTVSAGQGLANDPRRGQRPWLERPSAGQRPSGRPSAGQRPSGAAGRRQCLRQRRVGGPPVSVCPGPRQHGGRWWRRLRGGGFHGGGGGGFRGGGGGGFRGGGGGGRRSDIGQARYRSVGRLPNGLGYFASATMAATAPMSA